MNGKKIRRTRPSDYDGATKFVIYLAIAIITIAILAALSDDPCRPRPAGGQTADAVSGTSPAAPPAPATLGETLHLEPANSRPLTPPVSETEVYKNSQNRVVRMANYDDYLDALAWVESRNQPLRGNDGELGPWQITRDYWEEGLAMHVILPGTPGYEFTLKNCSHPIKAWAAISGYALRYDSEALMICHYRRMAYLHTGMNKPQSARDHYADRVLKRMAEIGKEKPGDRRKKCEVRSAASLLIHNSEFITHNFPHKNPSLPPNGGRSMKKTGGLWPSAGRIDGRRRSHAPETAVAGAPSPSIRRELGTTNYALRTPHSALRTTNSALRTRNYALGTTH